MTRATDKPWLHLPLDERFGASLRDISGNRHNAVASGELEIVDDEQRGACLDLSGGALTLPVMDPATFAAGCTVMFWARHATDGALFTFGTAGNRLSFAQSASESGTSDVVAVFEGAYISRVEHRVSSADEWFLFAATMPATGALKIVSPDPQEHPQAAAASAWNLLFGSSEAEGARQIVVGSREYRGRLAQLRIFARELGADEVQALRDHDVAAVRRPEAALPVAIAFEDGDASPVLFIDARPDGQAMTLRVTNRSRAAIHLALRDGEATADNAHFVLAFRPGTLRRLADVRVVGDGWKLASSPAGSDPLVPEDRLFLLANGTPSLPVAVTLAGLVADGRDGTRTTRIQLQYQHLRSAAAEELLRGTRSQQLALINRQGWRPVPVHVTGVGTTRVAIDQSASLRVHVSNFLPEAEGNTLGFDERACIQVSFDEGADAEWALARRELVKQIRVRYDRTTVGPDSPLGQLEEPDESRSSRWVLPLAGLASLAPREQIAIVIDGIQAEGPPGPTHVYIDLVNIPGYWDNRITCDIEKVAAEAAAPGWQALPLDGWTPFGAGPPAYHRDSLGRIYLRGGCTRSGTLGGDRWPEVALTLPDECRPEQALTLHGAARTRVLGDPGRPILHTWCSLEIGDPASMQPPVMLRVDPIGRGPGEEYRFADFLRQTNGVFDGADFTVVVCLDGVSYLAVGPRAPAPQHDPPPGHSDDPPPQNDPPPQHDPQPQRRESAGSFEGDAFDDTDLALALARPISRVSIRSGNIVDGLRVGIDDQDLPWHGGDGGAQQDHSFADGDLLTEISGFVGQWYGRQYVLQLLLRTRSGAQYGPFGDMSFASDAQPFQFTAEPGRHIAALFGASILGDSADGVMRPYLTGIGAVIIDAEVGR